MPVIQQNSEVEYPTWSEVSHYGISYLSVGDEVEIQLCFIASLLSRDEANGKEEFLAKYAGVFPFTTLWDDMKVSG